MVERYPTIRTECKHVTESHAGFLLDWIRRRHTTETAETELGELSWSGTAPLELVVRLDFGLTIAYFFYGYFGGVFHLTDFKY